MTTKVQRLAVEPTIKSRYRNLQPLDAAQIENALLRISTVEAITGLSRSTIYSLIQRQEFATPIRMGARCTRFRARDIQAWLASKVE